MTARAEPPAVDVRVEPGAQYVAKVRVRFNGGRPAGERYIWFLDEYGLIRGMSRRISPPVRMFDAAGSAINERWVPSEGRIDAGNLAVLEYTVLLGPPAGSRFGAAHTSWVNASGGVLMLDDLLPQSIGKSASVHLTLPAGWQAFSPGACAGSPEMNVPNLEKAAVRIGPSIRQTLVHTKTGEIRVGISGDWLFTDADAATMAASIADEYTGLFGALAGSDFTISIARFPFDVETGNWEGDTRGRSVTIFSSDMPFKNQSLQRLHEQLRHELFHLWVPNGLSLNGNYDWFYEGFALYQSLRTGVEMNQIRFEDYLDTLGRAFDIDAASNPRSSLIGATRERWNGAGTQVYARGMIVAFLCDLALLERSKGRVTVPELVRELFAKHGRETGEETDGDEAVMAVMRKHPELLPIVQKYISGSATVDWTDQLQSAGLLAKQTDGVTTLGADPKASGSAKKIREKLGIDNWRRGAKN